MISGLLVVLFAIGSSIASRHTMRSKAYVWIKRLNQDWECVDAKATCNNDAGDDMSCMIYVRIDFGLPAKDVIGHRSLNCDILLLRGGSPEPIIFDPSGTDVEDAKTN
jgi:hypothetical protein